MFLIVSLSSGAVFAGMEIDVLASMTGKCSTLKVAGTDFSCSGVTFLHAPGGRSGYSILIDDPDDDTHIITFSGEHSKKEQDNLYELTIDRTLLQFKGRPKVDGFPTPLVEASTGKCSQIGNLAKRKVSSVSCVATDQKGKRYEFQFESDGSPANVMRIREADVAAEEARAKVIATHMVRRKCLQKAIDKGVLPRDRTAFIIQCMGE